MYGNWASVWPLSLILGGASQNCDHSCEIFSLIPMISSAGRHFFSIMPIRSRYNEMNFKLVSRGSFYSPGQIYLTEKLPRLTWSLRSKWCCTNSRPANLDVRFLSRNLLTNSWAASSSPSCASTIWGWASRNPFERSSMTLLWSSKKVSKLLFYGGMLTKST